MAGWAMMHREFFEGIRAKLVDKDFRPRWRYSKGYFFD